MQSLVTNGTTIQKTKLSENLNPCYDLDLEDGNQSLSCQYHPVIILCFVTKASASKETWAKNATDTWMAEIPLSPLTSMLQTIHF